MGLRVMWSGEGWPWGRGSRLSITSLQAGHGHKPPPGLQKAGLGLVGSEEREAAIR